MELQMLLTDASSTSLLLKKNPIKASTLNDRKGVHLKELFVVAMFMSTLEPK